MIKNFTPRLYQETIFSTASLKNTLIVLPTGMGKTNIFLMLVAQRLKQYPDSKILFLGPTRPLIDQYKKVFEKHLSLSSDDMVTFTGSVKPEKREQLWKTAKIIFSTPQGLENDIMNGRIHLKDVSLLGFDEAHRAVGEYSYVWIAKRYHEEARFSRIVAMTASPGADKEKINEVCRNLFIEDIEVRGDDDPDVAPYVQEVKTQWIEVELSEELKQIHKELQSCYKGKLQAIKERGYLPSVDGISKTQLLGLQASLHGELRANTQDFSVMKCISLCAEALKVSHAVELLETQGLVPTHKYLLELHKSSFSTKTKAVKNLVLDPYFRAAMLRCESAAKNNIEHPKITRLRELMKDFHGGGKKTIIFNQYRDSAEIIVKELNELEGISARLFCGQQKKGTTGMSQKEQLALLDQFRHNEFNTIVMTSVGEEGLDIPKVDRVLFFEPIPSAIRHIQRRGRTGRNEKGEVMVLVTKGTRDEGYRWSAHHKEKRMHTLLKKLKDEFHKEFQLQKNLTEYTKKKVAANKAAGKVVRGASGSALGNVSGSASFEEQKPVIYVDNREKGNDIPKRLIDKGMEIRLRQLTSADYIISERAGIEFKKAEDFVASLIDKRLFSQLPTLVDNFERPLMIIEGTDLYSIRNVHPNAILGALSSIMVDFRVPLFFTKDAEETADLIVSLTKREQEQKKGLLNPNQQKRGNSIEDQKELILCAFPHIGGKLAKDLLVKFGTLEKIFSASEEELTSVEGLGKIKAKEFKALLHK